MWNSEEYPERSSVWTHAGIFGRIPAWNTENNNARVSGETSARFSRWIVDEISRHIHLWVFLGILEQLDRISEGISVKCTEETTGNS